MAAAASYSPTEAAYIVGQPVKAVQKAIDEGGVASRRVRQGRAVVRRLGEPELVYLRLLKDVSGTLLPAAKRRLYRSLKEQRDGASAVRLGPVTVDVSQARRDVAARAEELRRARSLVVSDPDIRGGEPVLRGTRVPVHMLLELAKQGAPVEELIETYPWLAREQVEAALTYARAYPRRGRPQRRPWLDHPLGRADAAARR